jgi:hypothetical protein
MSDDEDDVVVLRVCHTKGCVSMDDLQFDEEVGELFCGACRELYARALRDGFALLLNEDDRAVVGTIFTTFDSDRKGFWTVADYAAFIEVVTRDGSEAIETDEELRDFFKSEYDVALMTYGGGEFGICLQDLLDMYGGYQFNGIDALREDSERLEAEGAINLSALE